MGLLTAGDDGKVKIWEHNDKNSWTEAKALSISDSAILSISLHPTENFVTAVSGDTWSFVDLRSGDVLFSKSGASGNDHSSFS
jgi:hypothetical protein